MALRLGKFLLFALAALFSFYNLFNIAAFGRVYVRHKPGAWTYFADHPWTVGGYGVVYLIAGATALVLCYEALFVPARKYAAVESSRPKPNVTAGQFFRALLSAYLRPEK